jgi:glucose/arabinose dehydrogenase/PKD repeat protein
VRFGAVTLLLASLAVGAASAPASAATLPAGFSVSQYSTGLGSFDLANFVFLPGGNGSMLVTGKCGAVRRVDLSGNSVSIGSVSVFCEHDRGLLGVAVAPDYATSRTVYFLYDYLLNGKATGRLSRVTVNNAAAPTSFGNESVILDGLPSWSSTGATCDDSHTIGTVVAAPDGTLYVGNGDGSSYCSADPSALAALHINDPRGKIFHINTDGTGVTSNPFYQSSEPSSWQSRVFAYGLRNPFRFALKPDAEPPTLYIGDVGWNDREEVDIASGGEDFGWPCYEGPLDFRNAHSSDNECQILYSRGGLDSYNHQVVAPAFYWPHTGGNASVGGDFYLSNSYPAQFQGSFFFADYAAGLIYTLDTKGVGSQFATGVGGTVALHVGPNGDIFFADINSSNIFRLRYSAVPNQFPVAVAKATTPTVGTPPLTVGFNGAASSDPDAGDTISFAWDFGDGSAVSTAQNPTHTYTKGGVFTAKLTVTDNHGASDFDTVTVTTTNNPPVLTVTPLPAGATYGVGSQVTITATATDKEDGTLPAASITYQNLIHHCPLPGSCHIHPSGAVAGTAGKPYVTTISDHGDDSYLEVVVTATDAGGATAMKSVVVPTRQHVLSVTSSPAGIPVVVNATDSVRSPSQNEVVGSQNRVTAPVSSGAFVFDHWSDLGAQSHVFTMPDANKSLTAFYRSAPVPPVPPPSAGGWKLNGSAVMSGPSLVLTPATANQSGSAFWPTSVQTEGLKLSFDATIAHGTGADGLTFTFLDPSQPATSLGLGGGGLGFAGLTGVAVALDTYQGPTDPSANFVGVATGGDASDLTYAITSSNVPNLTDQNPHHVELSVLNGHLKVKVDGVQVVDSTTPLPKRALLGFTAGTGGLTDEHTITNVVVSPPAPILTVAPTHLDFGSVATGARQTRSFTVTNTGFAPLTIQSIRTSGGPFSVAAGSANTTILPQASARVTLTLQSNNPGTWSGVATIATTAGAASVTLAGSAVARSVPTVNTHFAPVTPYRLLDTRDAANAVTRGAPIGAGQEIALRLDGRPGEPASATSVLLNVTATQPAAAGYLRVYPCGTSPHVSTVNVDAGQTAANLALIALPGDHRVCVWSMVSTHVVLDVAGWFAPPGAARGAGADSTYHTVTPVRVLDTREPSLAPGGVAAPVAAGREVRLSLAGRSGFPSSASAALLNVTVTDPQGAGFVRAYPCGAEQVVSNINFVAGQTVANLVAVKVSAGGSVCVRTTAATNVVVDLSGWYAPGTAAGLTATAPRRLLDTRDARLAPARLAHPLQPGVPLTLRLRGVDGVPANASSIVLNVTVTNVAADGYLRVSPCGTSPNVSNVNYRPGQVAAANLVVVRLPLNGEVCVSSFARADVVLDLAGWYVG